MFEFPEITVLICTYNRIAEFGKTLAALRKNLQYPLEKIRWLVCDDHSPGTYAQSLEVHAAWGQIRPANRKVVVTPRNSGWGANVNNGLRQCETELVFFVEDDYVLTRPLDLRAGVGMFMVKPEFGMLRFRGTAGDHIVMHQLEADISEYHPTYQDGIGMPGKVSYLLLDSGSPSLYLYSHGAHLKRKSFHEFYGYYPEGLKLGATEESYAHIVKDRMRSDPYAPVIAIQPMWTLMHWDHIGRSYQHSELDKEHANVQS